MNRRVDLIVDIVVSGLAGAFAVFVRMVCESGDAI
jgi:hypothetical protein